MYREDNIKDTFHCRLRKLMEEYVFLVYEVTRDFPSDEKFGVTSQLRRAALSVILNYIEGYARRRVAVNKNFLEISYGSLKESDFLVYFSWETKYIKSEKSYLRLKDLGNEIGAMLWSTNEKIV